MQYLFGIKRSSGAANEKKDSQPHVILNYSYSNNSEFTSK